MKYREQLKVLFFLRDQGARKLRDQDDD
jgi:hypothetical protein